MKGLETWKSNPNAIQSRMDESRTQNPIRLFFSFAFLAKHASLLTSQPASSLSFPRLFLSLFPKFELNFSVPSNSQFPLFPLIVRFLPPSILSLCIVLHERGGSNPTFYSPVQTKFLYLSRQIQLPRLYLSLFSASFHASDYSLRSLDLLMN